MNSDMILNILKNSLGYIVFGVFAIIAIIYMVKYSIEIDNELYRQQIISNGAANYQTNSRQGSLGSPQLNTLRYSPKVSNAYSPMDSANTSFSSQQVPYNVNTNNNQTNINIPPRKTNLQSPSSPNANVNQYGNFMPPNNFRNSVTYNNRQSRQFLLQNNY